MDPSLSKWRGKYRTLKEYYETEYNPEYYKFDKYELEIDPDETMDDIEAYSKDRQMIEIKKCAFSFAYFCHKYVKIMHPIQGLMNFTLYNYQRRCVQEYEDHRFNIISKFRQGGLTTTTLVWALWKCLFQLDQQIMVCSKTDREAVDIGVMVDRSYDELPSWMSPPRNGDFVGTWNAHVKSFKETGGKIMFHTPEAARGKAITYLIIDEGAFIPEMETHWKALYPTLSTGGNCIVISTVNGMGNWYYETFMGAKEGINKFNIIELDYWEHPDYNNPVWVEDQKAQLGEDGWLQEVERNFLGAGDTYISSKHIEALQRRVLQVRTVRKLFPEWANKDSKEEAAMIEKEKKRRKQLGLGEEDWEELFEKGALWIFKEPLDGHEYHIGADCAEGLKADNSSFSVIDTSTMEQVAEFYSNTVPPQTFAEILHHIGKYYNTAMVVVENQSPGNSVIQLLQHNLFYDNLFYEHDGGKKSTAKCGIKTGPLNRSMILDALKRRILNGTVIINSRRLVKEIETFNFNKVTKKAEAQKGKHDDAIFGIALALFARDAGMRDIPVGGVTEDQIKDMQRHLTSLNYEHIKDEVMRGAPEDWLNDKEEIDHALMDDSEDIHPGVVFTFRRKYDKLLKEFGW